MRASRRYLLMMGVLPIGAILPKVPVWTLRHEEDRPFSAVGVTWAADPGVGRVTVAARARRRGAWTRWQRVGPGEPGGRRAGADLIWFGPSDGIELTVTTDGGAPPRDVAVDLIDPGDRPEDVAATSVEAVPPSIARRADWGADERKMTWKPEYAPMVKAIAVHHTATSNGYAAAEVPRILRAIYHYQAVTRGWGDVGYHVLVDRFGRLWEGRYGGLNRPVIGAHAGGFNVETAGIAVIGNHATVPVPAKVVESAARYVAWKFSLAPEQIDPRGTTSLTGGGSSSRFPPGTTIVVPRVFPHARTNKTTCPAARGLAVLDEIRQRAYQLGKSGTNGDRTVPIR